MVNYKKHLTPEKFQYINKVVNQRFTTNTSNQYKQAAVLHKVAARKIEYHSSGSKISSPEDMVDLQSGDCQDQTVLLASMLLAAGLDIRIIAARKIKENAGHVLVQVQLPDHTVPDQHTEIRDTHESLFNYRPDRLAYTIINGEKYFLADPEFSDYIGDRSSLVGEYIVEDGDDWEFHQIRREWVVEAKEYSLNKQIA
jgi:transglutaminase-like putative cysteine protease